MFVPIDHALLEQHVFTFGTHKTCTRHVYNLENLFES